MISLPHCSSFFFFNDTATTEIYTLSLHDALPISRGLRHIQMEAVWGGKEDTAGALRGHCALALVSCREDRKSTRLNSSHLVISYAVFCLKKKKNIKNRVDVEKCLIRSILTLW